MITPRQSSEKLFAHVIQSLGDSVFPGSDARLRMVASRNGSLLPPDLMVEAIFGHLASPAGARNLRPQAADSAPDSLERVIACLPIKPESRQAVADEMGFSLNGRPPGEIARAIVDRLDRRDFQAAHAHADWIRAPLNAAEAGRIQAVIDSRFSGELSASERADYATKLARTGGGNPATDAAIVQRVAATLKMSGKIAADDPRLRERDPAPTAADEVPREEPVRNLSLVS